MEEIMKKFLIIILGAIVLLTGTVSSFADSDIIAKDEQNEMPGDKIKYKTLRLPLIKIV